MTCPCIMCSVERTYNDLGIEVDLEREEGCLYYNKKEKTMNDYDLGDVKVSVTFDLEGQDLEDTHCCHCEVVEGWMTDLQERLFCILEPEPLITLELTPEEVARIAQLTALVEEDSVSADIHLKVEEFVDNEYMAELVDDVEASFSMSEGVVLKV